MAFDRQYDYFCANSNPGIEISDVLVGQANAAGRNPRSNRFRSIGVVNAIHGSAKIHGVSAKRIAGTAGHLPREIRLTRDHFRRRGPIRPLRFLGDPLYAGPSEAVTADADAVT